MSNKKLSIKFTGEFFIPGDSGERIEADHMERYKFATKFAQDKTILDIACGTGYSAPMFIGAQATHYDGVDINESLIEYSNNNYGSDHIKFHVGDICSFNNGRTYDMITCFETIEHIKDYELALKNLYNLLNPGGVLVISSPNRPITSPRISSLQDKPANQFHTQEFTPSELMSLLKKQNFRVKRNDVYGQHQRIIFPNKMLRKISRLLLGHPDRKSSPVVTKLKTNRVPRYFILIAAKQR